MNFLVIFENKLQILVTDVSLDQYSGMPEGLPQEDEHGPLKACEKASGSINGTDYEVTQSSIIKSYFFLEKILLSNSASLLSRKYYFLLNVLIK